MRSQTPYGWQRQWEVLGRVGQADFLPNEQLLADVLTRAGVKQPEHVDRRPARHRPATALSYSHVGSSSTNTLRHSASALPGDNAAQQHQRASSPTVSQGRFAHRQPIQQPSSHSNRVSGGNASAHNRRFSRQPGGPTDRSDGYRRGMSAPLGHTDFAASPDISGALHGTVQAGVAGAGGALSPVPRLQLGSLTVGNPLTPGSNIFSPAPGSPAPASVSGATRNCSPMASEPEVSNVSFALAGPGSGITFTRQPSTAQRALCKQASIHMQSSSQRGSNRSGGSARTPNSNASLRYRDADNNAASLSASRSATGLNELNQSSCSMAGGSSSYMDSRASGRGTSRSFAGASFCAAGGMPGQAEAAASGPARPTPRTRYRQVRERVDRLRVQLARSAQQSSSNQGGSGGANGGGGGGGMGGWAEKWSGPLQDLKEEVAGTAQRKAKLSRWQRVLAGMSTASSDDASLLAGLDPQERGVLQLARTLATLDEYSHMAAASHAKGTAQQGSVLAQIDAQLASLGQGGPTSQKGAGAALRQSLPQRAQPFPLQTAWEYLSAAAKGLPGLSELEEIVVKLKHKVQVVVGRESMDLGRSDTEGLRPIEAQLDLVELAAARSPRIPQPQPASGGASQQEYTQQQRQQYSIDEAEVGGMLDQPTGPTLRMRSVSFARSPLLNQSGTTYNSAGTGGFGSSPLEQASSSNYGIARTMTGRSTTPLSPRRQQVADRAGTLQYISSLLGDPDGSLLLPRSGASSGPGTGRGDHTYPSPSLGPGESYHSLHANAMSSSANLPSSRFNCSGPSLGQPGHMQAEQSGAAAYRHMSTSLNGAIANSPAVAAALVPRAGNSSDVLWAQLEDILIEMHDAQSLCGDIAAAGLGRPLEASTQGADAKGGSTPAASTTQLLGQGVTRDESAGKPPDATDRLIDLFRSTAMFHAKQAKGVSGASTSGTEQEGAEGGVRCEGEGTGQVAAVAQNERGHQRAGFLEQNVLRAAVVGALEPHHTEALLYFLLRLALSLQQGSSGPTGQRDAGFLLAAALELLLGELGWLLALLRLSAGAGSPHLRVLGAALRAVEALSQHVDMLAATVDRLGDMAEDALDRAEHAEHQLAAMHKALHKNATSVSDLGLYSQELEKEVARLSEQVEMLEETVHELEGDMERVEAAHSRREELVQTGDAFRARTAEWAATAVQSRCKEVQVALEGDCADPRAMPDALSFPPQLRTHSSSSSSSNNNKRGGRKGGGRSPSSSGMSIPSALHRHGSGDQSSDMESLTASQGSALGPHPLAAHHHAGSSRGADGHGKATGHSPGQLHAAGRCSHDGHPAHSAHHVHPHHVHPHLRPHPHLQLHSHASEEAHPHHDLQPHPHTSTHAQLPQLSAAAGATASSPEPLQHATGRDAPGSRTFVHRADDLQTATRNTARAAVVTTGTAAGGMATTATHGGTHSLAGSSSSRGISPVVPGGAASRPGSSMVGGRALGDSESGEGGGTGRSVRFHAAMEAGDSHVI